MNNQYVRGMLMAAVILLPSVSVAEPSVSLSSTPTPTKVDQVIVQIGGRFCEYLRQDVESALHRFQSVRQVEFLNDHGTVLVHYYAEGVSPTQLVSVVDQAVASGIGCKVWIDRGARPSEGS